MTVHYYYYLNLAIDLSSNVCVCLCVCSQMCIETSDDNLPVEQSSGDGTHDSVASSVAEVDSVAEPASPHLAHCDDDALASAENDNNLNVESENNNVADRSVEAAGTADVATAVVVENSQNITDLQLGDKQEEEEAFLVDKTQTGESCGVLDVSSRSYTTDTCETELTEDHAVLSSCSAMILEVQDDEFSDEETESEEKNESSSCKPPEQPGSSLSLIHI